MNKKDCLGKFLAIAAALIVIVAVAVSLWLNPPSVNKAISLDNLRFQRLNLSETEINEYYKAHGLLPDKLETLFDGINNTYAYDNIHDPETHELFAYEKLDDKSYRICINFARASDDTNTNRYSYRPHHAGLNCFEHDLGVNKK